MLQHSAGWRRAPHRRSMTNQLRSVIDTMCKNTHPWASMLTNLCRGCVNIFACARMQACSMCLSPHPCFYLSVYLFVIGRELIPIICTRGTSSHQAMTHPCSVPYYLNTELFLHVVPSCSSMDEPEWFWAEWVEFRVG